MQNSVEQPRGNVSRSVIYGLRRLNPRPCAAPSPTVDLKVRSGNVSLSLSLLFAHVSDASLLEEAPARKKILQKDRQVAR